MALRSASGRGVPLRRRLLTSALLGAVPLTVLGLILLISTYFARRGLILQNNLQSAILASAYIGGWVDAQLNALHSFALASEATGSAAARQGLIDRQFNPEVWTNLFYLDDDGRIVASHTPTRVSLAETPAFRQARDTGHPVVTNLITNPTTGTPVVLLLYPITRSGRFLGAVAASISSEQIQRPFARVPALEQTFFTLWGNDRRLIASTYDHPEMTGKQYTNAGLTPVVSGEPGVMITPRSIFEGRSILVGHAPVEHTPWAVAVATPTEVAMWPVYRNLVIYLVVTIAVLGLTIALAGYSANQVARDVAYLADAARKIGTGQLAAPVAPSDVTELNDLTDSLNRMAADLAVADRMKTDLLNLVSHELKTPLTTIRAFFDVLAAGLITPGTRQFREMLHGAMRQSRRLQDMIENMLNAARIEAGALSVEPRPVPVTALVEASARIYTDIIRDRGLALTIAVPADLCVMADLTRMTLVMNNLLDNAVKFTESGEIVIRAVPDGDQAVITVRDTGIGLTSEVTATLFQPFAISGPLMTRRSGGAGLGLPVVKALVEAHGGHAFATSGGAGKGSTFGFLLPRVACPTAQDG